MIKHFKPGQKVLALQSPGNWKTAIIMSDAPYPKAKTGGAYIQWIPFNPSSVGGWKSQNTILTLELNQTKTCFWHKHSEYTDTIYRMGDIYVEYKGRTGMWHVIIDGQTIETHKYLGQAKVSTHRIDKEAREMA